MEYLLLVVIQLAGLVLIPFGLPGTWLQVLGLVGYGWLTGFRTVGAVPIVVVCALALAAELIEFWLGGRFALRYGGSRRAAWGAVLGGIAGAVVGVPVPVIGSVVGAFIGSFAGAAAFELTRSRELSPALRVGWGALLGRLAAVAVKSGIGAGIAAIALFAAFR
ncbi:MAG TPA: DUF456 domain-containing protein [Longimicrobiaceae bacterium]|nr:DUF456 domain-containing protein [Longimicrobiaceae bacterium]